MNAKLLRPAVAELIGTALFVFVGAGTVVMTSLTPGAARGLEIAAAHGIALAVLVSAVMNISGGHLNPAVTLALFAARKVDGPTAGAYVGAQLVGAILAAALIKWLFPPVAVSMANIGTPALGAQVTLAQGIGIETVLTFLLMSVILGTAVSSQAPKVGGFAIGLAVFAGALAGGSLTGAALNPARAFGPALVAMEFHGQAVYWIGPILGATAAALLWKVILLPKDQRGV
ncbi:MAG: MIP/aquaporin family protein [Gemmatimonadales bacterium]